MLIFFSIAMITLLLWCNSSKLNDYKIYEKKFIVYNEKRRTFTVKYAQVSGISNIDLENKINKTLKLAITEWINKDCEWVEKFQIAVKYKTPKYLSLCYTIRWENPRGKNWMGNYTRIGVTVDMQTGDRIYLNKLIKDTANLKKKLINYSYRNEFSPPINSIEADKIIHDASISEKKYYKEIYKSDPFVYDCMISYSGSKSSFYLTDNKLVITRDRYDLDDVYIKLKQ